MKKILKFLEVGYSRLVDTASDTFSCKFSSCELVFTTCEFPPEHSITFNPACQDAIARALEGIIHHHFQDRLVICYTCSYDLYIQIHKK